MEIESPKKNNSLIYRFILSLIILIVIFTAGCTNNSTNNQQSPQSKFVISTETPTNNPTNNPTYVVTTASETLKERNIKTVKGIVEEYHKTHTYTLTGMYVCAQMAQDVWDMVETQKINAIIKVGNVTQNINKIQESTHAWVLAEVAPGEWIAMETTGGYLVCDDPSICVVNNPRYYTGWTFNTPKELQDYLNNPSGWGCPAGDVIGSDNLCHQACGVDTYCTGDSACVNDKCVSNPYACPSGYILGKDNLCHMACGANTYCTGNSICVNGQCRSCNPGYIMGQDLLCHPECPIGSETYCINGVCGNDGKCHRI
jgi:hypothetical protein